MVKIFGSDNPEDNLEESVKALSMHKGIKEGNPTGFMTNILKSGIRHFSTPLALFLSLGLYSSGCGISPVSHEQSPDSYSEGSKIGYITVQGGKIRYGQDNKILFLKNDGRQYELVDGNLPGKDISRLLEDSQNMDSYIDSVVDRVAYGELSEPALSRPTLPALSKPTLYTPEDVFMWMPISDFDLNRDRVVDFRDFLLLAKNFGKKTMDLPEQLRKLDYNGNGVVDREDFDTFTKYFGFYQGFLVADLISSINSPGETWITLPFAEGLYSSIWPEPYRVDFDKINGIWTQTEILDLSKYTGMKVDVRLVLYDINNQPVLAGGGIVPVPTEYFRHGNENLADAESNKFDLSSRPPKMYLYFLVNSTDAKNMEFDLRFNDRLQKVWNWHAYYDPVYRETLYEVDISTLPRIGTNRFSIAPSDPDAPHKVLFALITSQDRMRSSLYEEKYVDNLSQK